LSVYENASKFNGPTEEVHKLNKYLRKPLIAGRKTALGSEQRYIYIHKTTFT